MDYLLTGNTFACGSSIASAGRVHGHGDKCPRRAGVTLVRLALDGIPPPVPGRRINSYLLSQLWKEGLSVPVVAHRAGRSTDRTRAEIDQAGDALPHRLTAQQIAARFGWTRTNVRGLPTPPFP